MAETLDTLVNKTAEIWRPAPHMHLSDWADEYFYLSSESSATPGKWETLPYQRGIMDAISDPEIERVTLMKSARVGYTKIINAAVGYFAHHEPTSILILLPTDGDAERHSKEEIAPMIRDTPVLEAIFFENKTRDSGNTILSKQFIGGVLSLAGANAPRGLRAMSRRIIFFDEIDGYPLSAGAEGDPVKLAERRAEWFWNRKYIKGSTPTIEGRSRITAEYEQGDMRRYFVPCPSCHEMQYLKWGNMHWPEGKPAEAYYECEHCRHHIGHGHKRWMVEHGEWRATAPFKGHASFHIWAAYSYSPNASWGQLAEEFIEAKRGGVETLKTFINTVLGEPWRERGEAPEWERLYERREAYPMGSIPHGVMFLTAGVDVQKDRLVFEVTGWGRGKQSWSIDAGVLPGDTATEAPWNALDDLLNRKYTNENGAEMGVLMLAVDSGYNTQIVYNWARRYPRNRVMAVRGVSTAKILIGTPSPVDVTRNGKKMRKGYSVWPVGVDIAKGEFYNWLGLDKPTEANLPYPPGYCHFPEYGPDYFKQITAEQLVLHRRKNNTTRFEWEVIPNRENHYLDCRIYSRAAAAQIGLDRFKESDWLRLEDELAGPRHDPTPPSAPADAGSNSGPVAGSAGNSWIKRKPGGWLKR